MSPLDLHSTWILAERNAVFWFYLPLTVFAKPSTLLKPVPDCSKRNAIESLCKSCNLGTSALWVFTRPTSAKAFPNSVSSEVVSSFMSKSSVRIGTGQHATVGVRDFFACTKSFSGFCEIQVCNVLAFSSRTDFDQGMSHSSVSPPQRSLWF